MVTCGHYPTMVGANGSWRIGGYLNGQLAPPFATFIGSYGRGLLLAGGLPRVIEPVLHALLEFAAGNIQM